MGERVSTGGLMSFDYSKSGKEGRLSEDQKKGIQEGYAMADSRKRREKKRKLMIVILVVIIVVGGLLGVFLR